jgi:hypothetical protein
MAAWLGLPGGTEELDARLIRAVMFGTVVAITGTPFDHSRQAMIGWRTEAIEIAQREPNGRLRQR